jgi:hypothetical protein
MPWLTISPGPPQFVTNDDVKILRVSTGLLSERVTRILTPVTPDSQDLEQYYATQIVSPDAFARTQVNLSLTLLRVTTG